MLVLRNLLWYLVPKECGKTLFLCQSESKLLKNEVPYLEIPADSSERKIGYNIGTRFGNWLIMFSYNFIHLSRLIYL